MFRFTNIIIFRMTRDCNLNCKYCFMLEKDHYKDERIDFELYKKIIDRIVEQRLLNRNLDEELTLVFHGGEALMIGKEKLYKIAEYATNQFRKHGIKYNLGMQTNATLLDEDFAKILNKFEISVGLSFDGIEGANNDRTDIKQQIFEKKFKLLEENKVKFGFLLVASKSNIDHFSKTKEFLSSYGVNSYKVNYAEDMINPGPDSEFEVSGEEIFEKVYKVGIDEFIETGQVANSIIKELLDMAVVDLLTHHNPGYKSGCGGKFCGGVIGMIGVNPDGEMHFCDRYSKEFPETYVQHALDYDFLGIYQQKKAVEFQSDRIRVIKETGCDTCPADYICEHGCTAMHFSKYGVNGIDKSIVCPISKGSYDYILKNIVPILKAYMMDKDPKVSSRTKIHDSKKRMEAYLRKNGIEFETNSNSIYLKEKK